MTEDDYLERLSQVEFDLAFLKKRIRTLDFNIAVADMEGNTLESNKLKRWKKQHERYIGYAKLFKRHLTSQYDSMLLSAKEHK